MKVALLILALVTVPVLWSTNPSSTDFSAYVVEKMVTREREQAPVLLFGRTPEPSYPVETGIRPERQDYYLFSVYTYQNTAGDTIRYLGVAQRFIRIN
ncbi:DUF4359 domain-containing protein [Rhodocaloribacter litoris]|uniref:DUF4359 domain-containing protein n=1 Tax=Rhodocaloribacter litoris TaxID=2558931 RepID=UPI001E5C598C|nr:DUF4359 domain-containing protein [Rhodocaloribacter litoris]QXD15290.1 DUF4359 domain-containing protein [Rhodocaloribacter litoris]GIV62291.1 MAG: hypothetical protein KatS3mg044_1157 [Rhodothermaceae bacterium]